MKATRKPNPRKPAIQPPTTRALGSSAATNAPAPAVAPTLPEQPRPLQPSAETEQQPRASTAPTRSNQRGTAANGKKKVVFILANAGLRQGREGLIDAYDRGATTRVATPELEEYRPDIVHQCLLAIFDSDIATAGLAQVFIVTTKGKTIEVNPTLRPPRTYGRFKGLIEKLLDDGVVRSLDGDWLMRTSRWSIAPHIPHGAEVIGIHNDESSPVVTAVSLAAQAVAEPVPDTLQGGTKGVAGFYCVSCTDTGDLSGLDFVTKPVSISPFPTTCHVACARIAEGFRHATEVKPKASRSGDAAAPAAAVSANATSLPPGAKRPRTQKQ